MEANGQISHTAECKELDMKTLKPLVLGHGIYYGDDRNYLGEDDDYSNLEFPKHSQAIWLKLDT